MDNFPLYTKFILFLLIANMKFARSELQTSTSLQTNWPLNYIPPKLSNFRPALDIPGIKSQVDLYCKQFGLVPEKRTLFGRLGDQRNGSPRNTIAGYDSCRQTVEKYFIKRTEVTVAIQQYVDLCKERGLQPVFCAEIIIHFFQLDWDLTSLHQMLSSFNTDRYTKENTKYYKHIGIFRTDWFIFKFGQFHLGMCLDRFPMEYFINDEMKIQPVSNYKEWCASQSSLAVCQCHCIDVYGLTYVQNARTRVESRHISNYFSWFCRDDYVQPGRWTLKQYKSISESASKYTFHLIRMFLRIALPISEAGWIENDKNSHWTFHSIADFIRLSDHTVIQEERQKLINLVALAIKLGFTSENFHDFDEIMNKVSENFLQTECKINVLKVIYFEDETENDDAEKEVPQSKPNYMYWHRNDKDLFNKHLTLILKTLKDKDKEDQSCSMFVENFQRLEDLFYSSKLTHKSYTEKIQEEIESESDLEGVITVLQGVINSNDGEEVTESSQQT